MYTLKQLEQICKKCRKCSLSATRKSVVFGEGNDAADIMFVGEGPGYNEDIQGRPFVGKAGQLLTKMINAINMRRGEVYITNIVKCRPPENRNPLESESDKCIEFLRWQVKLIKPGIIVALGAVSAKNIIRPDFKISKERGKWIEKSGINFIATYHPSYLLRNPAAKKEAWEDFKEIKKMTEKIKSENNT